MVLRKAGWIVTFVMIAVMLKSSNAAGLTLVQDGKAQVCVVVSDKAPVVVKEAAADFIRIILKMSGAQLSIVPESQSDSTKSRVLIGDCQRPVNLGGDPLVIKGDDAYAGYVIACDKMVLSLCGNSPVGTANAVYGFLQDHLGVRWFLPTESFEIIPGRKTIVIPEMRQVITPDFVCRLGSASWNNENRYWGRHNRWDIGEGRFAVPFAAGFTHWMYALFPPSKFAKTHPDIYPLLNGKRAIPSEDGVQLSQPCTGNPLTAQIAIETINAYFDQHPETHSYPFSINDNNTWCECDVCRAQDVERPLHRGTRIYSDRWFKFVNTVAKGIYAKHPDKFISCIAYAGVELPPLKITRIEPNVCVNITQDTSQFFDRTYEKEDYTLIRDWQRKCNLVGRSNYYGLGAIAPRYFPHLLAKDLKAIHLMGIRVFHSEVYPHWANMGPMLYLAGRLLWRVNLDPDQLLNEFYTSCFGPAAKEMKLFYELHESAWMSQKKGKWFNGIGSVEEQMGFYTASQVQAAALHLKKAKMLAQDESTRKRIQLLACNYVYSDVLLQGWATAHDIMHSQTQSSKGTKTMIRNLETILELLKSEESAWKSSIMDDPVVDGWYKNGARPSLRGQWRSKIQAAMVEGMQQMSVWSQSGEGKRNSAEIEKLMKGLNADPQIKFLWQVIEGKLQLEPNLLPNPGFEVVKASTPSSTSLGWHSSSLAEGWNTWQEDCSRGIFYLDEQVKHSGKYSGIFKGGGCLCYITTVPIKTGKNYLAEVWAQSPTTRDSTKVTLEVRWNDAQGRWFSKAPDFRVETKKAGVWERLMIPFIAPEGAARAVILLAGYGIENEDVVRFDDAFAGEGHMQ